MRTVLTGADAAQDPAFRERVLRSRQDARATSSDHAVAGRKAFRAEPAGDDGEEKSATGLKEGDLLPEVPLRELAIHVDRELGEVVIQVVDTETRKVLRQIPPEEALEMLRRFSKLKGSLIDTEG